MSVLTNVPVCTGFKDDFSTWDSTCEKKDENELGNKPVKEEASAEIPIMINAMKKMYKEKLRPLEVAYSYDKFSSPLLKDAYFEAKPFVLLIGQYSVGKTTFIRYLLERDFPGVRIGPEPTTDRFMCLMNGPVDRTIPGNALCADASKPFTQLTSFGMGFLNKFECAECASPILEKVSFIDTPGILSGEKQREGRGYDFPTMCEWFAGRSDRILLLFDAHKLDISDEMRRTIERIRDNDDKVRVVLNKADIPTQQLVRVYGSLMWSLGKVYQTPEVLRVFVGSFWDQPLKNTENAELMKLEEQDLLADLRRLPHNVAIRKVNELIKRARKANIHAKIMRHLKAQMPTIGSKPKKQAKLLENLGPEFKKVMDEHNLPKNDFPNIQRFREVAATIEIWKFKGIKKDHDIQLTSMLEVDMPKLMSMVPSEVQDGELESKDDVANPFAQRGDTAIQGVSWCVSGAIKKSLEGEFNKIKQTGGKILASDGGAYLFSLNTEGFGQKVLFKLWTLSDIDGDSALDAAEFCVACVLMQVITNQCRENIISNTTDESCLPDVLPDALIPPSKRWCFKQAGS